MDLKTQILVALGLSKSEDVSTEETSLSFQAKLVDGTIIVSEDDALIEGSLVNVLTEDGTTMPLPIGEYRTEDGLGFVVETEGTVSSLLTEEAPQEEAPVEEEEAQLEEEVLEEEVLEEEAPVIEATPMNTPKSITTTTTEKVEFNKDEFLSEINESIVALKSEIELLKSENVELKTQLDESATLPVNTNKFSQETKSLTKTELSKMTRQERFLYKLTK
jgi:hypothetical protein